MPNVGFLMTRPKRMRKHYIFQHCVLCKSSEDKYLYLLDNKNMLFFLLWRIKQIFVELCLNSIKFKFVLFIYLFV